MGQLILTPRRIISSTSFQLWHLMAQNNIPGPMRFYVVELHSYAFQMMS